jgi:restriction endonuclease S subunit
MLNKATAQVAALNKELQKGIERLIRRAYKPLKIYRGNFSVKSTTSLKRMDWSCVIGFFRV